MLMGNARSNSTNGSETTMGDLFPWLQNGSCLHFFGTYFPYWLLLHLCNQILGQAMQEVEGFFFIHNFGGIPVHLAWQSCSTGGSSVLLRLGWKPKSGPMKRMTLEAPPFPTSLHLLRAPQSQTRATS